MTLNGIIALILLYFTEGVVEDRPTCILSTEYCLPLWPKLTHPAAQSLCNS